MGVVLLIGYLIVLLVPILILIMGIYNYFQNVKITEILVKLIIAFLLYFVFTLAITIFFITYIATLIIVTADAIPPQPMTEPIIVTSITILVFMFLGLLLCWFVKRDLGDSLSSIVGNPENLPTLLND